jgi:hypothetical protein
MSRRRLMPKFVVSRNYNTRIEISRSPANGTDKWWYPSEPIRLTNSGLRCASSASTSEPDRKRAPTR